MVVSSNMSIYGFEKKRQTYEGKYGKLLYRNFYINPSKLESFLFLTMCLLIGAGILFLYLPTENSNWSSQKQLFLTLFVKGFGIFFIFFGIAIIYYRYYIRHGCYLFEDGILLCGDWGDDDHNYIPFKETAGIFIEPSQKTREKIASMLSEGGGKEPNYDNAVWKVSSIETKNIMTKFVDKVIFIIKSSAPVSLKYDVKVFDKSYFKDYERFKDIIKKTSDKYTISCIDDSNSKTIYKRKTSINGFIENILYDNFMFVRPINFQKYELEYGKLFYRDFSKLSFIFSAGLFFVFIFSSSFGILLILSGGVVSWNELISLVRSFSTISYIILMVLIILGIPVFLFCISFGMLLVQVAYNNMFSYNTCLFKEGILERGSPKYPGQFHYFQNIEQILIGPGKDKMISVINKIEDIKLNTGYENTKEKQQNTLMKMEELTKGSTKKLILVMKKSHAGIHSIPLDEFKDIKRFKMLLLPLAKENGVGVIDETIS